MSVTAAAVVRDTEVRTMFDKICFVSVGQQPVIHVLYRQLHIQLCEGKHLDPSLVDDDACFQALRRACQGHSILLVMDDAWAKSHVEMLDCVDPASNSCVVVTSRVSGIAVGAPEVQLGSLPPDDSVALMYAVCGKKVEPPFNQVEHDAATACGRLPLALNIAGGMLKQAGGVINRAFVDMLSEDHGEVLREGEFGDLHVSLEDRLVGKTLEHYQGSHRDGVLRLFSFLAAFPEDVLIPAAFFEMFATSLLGAIGKRPQLRV